MTNKPDAHLAGAEQGPRQSARQSLKTLVESPAAHGAARTIGFVFNTLYNVVDVLTRNLARPPGGICMMLWARPSRFSSSSSALALAFIRAQRR